MRHWLLALACAPLLLCHASRAEHLPIRSYTTSDGLAHNTINRVVRDSRGFLWFCTEEGLSRFDGYQFTNYTTNEGLPHGAVTDFLEKRDGTLWVGTTAGLVRFNPKGSPTGRVVYAGAENGISPMFTCFVPDGDQRLARLITVLHEGRDGTIWAGTMRGLLRLEHSGGRFHLRSIDLEASLPENRRPNASASRPANPPLITDLLEDRYGTLWVGTFGALFRRWPDGSTARYTPRDGLPDDTFHDLFEDHQGRLWVATRGAGFFRFTADGTHAPPVVVRTYTARDGLDTNWVVELFETSDHRFWVATNRGVAEFFPDAGEHESSFKAGLFFWGLNTLSEDLGGNLWLGGDSGAMKLARDETISYGSQDGLMSVFAIFPDRAGRPCFRGAVFGDERTSVFEGARFDMTHPLEYFHTRYGCFDGRHFTWLKPDAIANIGWVGEMVTLQARNGEWWMGTGSGIYRFPPSGFAGLKHARPLAVYTTKDALTASQVFRLFEDSRGDVWASAIQPNGIARWQRAGATWRDVTNDPGLPSPKDDLARAFGEDRDGNVWVGFNTGIARYRGGHFAFFPAKDTLMPGSVMNIYTDRAGRLWFTSARSGLVRIDDPSSEHPRFVHYTTAEGLSSNFAEAITEDLAGHIYVSTGRGLDRLDPATGHIKHFTTADGLAPGEVKAGFRDAGGALWFATTHGLSRLVPAADPAAAAPPPIVITALRIADKQQPVSALGETEMALPDIAPDRNQLQVDFVGLSFAPGDTLRYQYRLDGADRDWGPATSQRSVNYARLAPGTYRFLVRAVNSDGATSPRPAAIRFTILAPFWQRWWFLMAVALALGTLARTAYRYRVARRVELEMVRTRIASDLHDDIGAGLSRIAVLSEVARHEADGVAPLRERLAVIARASRELVDSMSDIVWVINPQRDELRELVQRMRRFASDVFTARDIRFTFHAPADERHLKVSADVRRHVSLIFKEAVNNILRHSGCTAADIELRIATGSLVLTVRDNGRGFNPACLSDGNGLANMRARARAVGGELRVETGNGLGTTVTLAAPLRAVAKRHNVRLRGGAA